MVCHQRRTLGERRLQAGIDERAPIEGTEEVRGVDRTCVTPAEALFATDVEREVRAQRGTVFVEEPCHPAEVVVVPVRQHQRVERPRVDAHQVEVVVQRRRRVAEVDENATGLVAALGRHVQGQPPLVLQRPWYLRRGWRAVATDLDVTEPPRRLHRVVIRVGHDRHRQPVDLGHHVFGGHVARCSQRGRDDRPEVREHLGDASSWHHGHGSIASAPSTRPSPVTVTTSWPPCAEVVMTVSCTSPWPLPFTTNWASVESGS